MLLAGTVMLVGCGNHRTPLPPVTQAALGGGTRPVPFVREGLFLAAPRPWFVTPGTAPQVVTLSSGPANVVVWRYVRAQPLPRTEQDVRRLMPALLGAVRARDPTFSLQEIRALRLAGHPALQVVGIESLAGEVRRVRSDHIFAFGSEFVIDAYAPQASFYETNRAAFVPILHSLRLGRPR